MENFKVGQRVFVGGKLQTRGMITFVGIEDYGVHTPNTNTMHMGVPAECITLACDEVYKIGQHIESTLGGGFNGVVTGFEYETNKVVCKSCKSNSDRTRYAYSLDEIKPYEECWTFYVNKRYVVNGSTKVKCISIQRNGYAIGLLDEQNGEVLYLLPKYKMTMKALHKEGIYKVEVDY